jgi:membrane-associated protein
LEAITAGDRFFAKHGPKAVFFARWIALVRFAAAWLAGINEMPFRQFFLYNALGGISWGVTFGLVGYFAGSAAADVITKFGVYAAVVLAVIAVGAYLVYKSRERRLGGKATESAGKAEATDSSGGAEATDSSGGAEATDSSGGAEATDSSVGDE